MATKEAMMPDTPTAEHADWREMMTLSGEQADDMAAVLDKHFKVFAQPPLNRGDDDKLSLKGDHPCLNCGEPQTGLLGNFRWGLIHGEGVCLNCGWPARLYHFFKNSTGEDMGTLTMLFQYHPDYVEQRQQRAKGK
jgi:hypothetical protein